MGRFSPDSYFFLIYCWFIKYTKIDTVGSPVLSKQKVIPLYPFLAGYVSCYILVNMIVRTSKE